MLNYKTLQIKSIYYLLTETVIFVENRKPVSKNIYFLISFLAISTTLFAQKKYQGLLWEISGNGLEQPSHLYGTMHTTDERAFQFKDGVMEAFDNSSIYAMELNMDSVGGGNLLGMLVMDSAQSLSSLIDSSEYLMVQNFFRDTLKQSLMMYDKMQPMFTATLIGMRDLKSDRESALDLFLFKRAKEQGKRLIGLEKLEEQIGAFNAIPYQMQADGLVMAVESIMSGEAKDTSEVKLIDHYMKGDLDKMLEFTDEFGSEDPEAAKLFMEVFLIKRNYNMTDRSEQYLKAGNAFIAVGAAHLPGEEGVIELLRKKGYTVEPK
jgi:uncharacterized protein YbaP (TraB family)